MPHYNKNSRLARTGKKAQIDDYYAPKHSMSRPDSDLQVQLKKLVASINMSPPEDLVDRGGKFYSDPREAAQSLGMDVNRTQVAERLIEMVASDARDMYGVATLAQEAGIPDPAVRAILRRGQQMSFRNQISKAKAAPEGTRSTHGGKKVVKQGGKWLPVKGGGGSEKKETKGKNGKKKKIAAKVKGVHPDVKARFAGIQAQARRHKVKITGDLKDHHDHEHMDALQGKLDDHVKGKAAEADKKEKADRKSPDDAQGKQAMQQEVGDLVDKLKGVEHRIDDDHRPMYDRLLGEAKSITKAPTGAALDWYEKRVDSFIHLATGRSPDGSDVGSPPSSSKDKEWRATLDDDQRAELEKWDAREEQYKQVRDTVKDAGSKLKGMAKTAASRLIHGLQHTVEEFPAAAKAVGKLADGTPLTAHDRKAMVSVGVTLGAVALAGVSMGGAAAGATFGQKFMTHVATAAVHQHATSAYVGYSALGAGQKALYMMDLIKAKKEEPKEIDKKEEAPDDEVSPEMIAFAQGVMEQMGKLLDREWSDDEIDMVMSEDDGEDVAKSAVYFDLRRGRMVTGAEVLKKALTAGHAITRPKPPPKKKVDLVIKGRGLPAGTIRTHGGVKKKKNAKQPGQKYIKKSRTLPPRRFGIGEETPPPEAPIRVYQRFEPIAKAKGLFTQLVDGEITVSGDLEKAGVPSYMLSRAGAKTLKLNAVNADDLVKVLS